LDAQFNLEVLDDRPSQNGVDGNVGTKRNAKNGQFSTGYYPVREVPQVDSTGGHQVVDMNRYGARRELAGGGGLLEDLHKDCEEADSICIVSVRWRRPVAVGHPWLRSILGPATGAANGSKAATRAVTSSSQGVYLRFSG
jgi:hypothetical protein